jgi:hypothetical protein
MNPFRTRRMVAGQIPNRASISPLGAGIVPLEFKLRQLHQRRRRAAIRQLLIGAIWSAGLLSVAAFVIVLVAPAVQR